MEVQRVFATFGALSRENIFEIVPSGAMFDHMEAMLVRKYYHSWFKSLSRGDMLEIVTLQAFPIPLSSRWAMFTTLKSLSRRSMLEIMTSGAMFDYMHALLLRKCYRSWTWSLLISAPVEPNITSKAMSGNMEVMFGHVRVFLFQFTTFKSLSRRHVL